MLNMCTGDWFKTLIQQIDTHTHIHTYRSFSILFDIFKINGGNDEDDGENCWNEFHEKFMLINYLCESVCVCVFMYKVYIIYKISFSNKACVDIFYGSYRREIVQYGMKIAWNCKCLEKLTLILMKLLIAVLCVGFFFFEKMDAN